MKTKILCAVVLLFTCFGSGFLGACLAIHIAHNKEALVPSPVVKVQSSDSVIQARGLELVDGNRNVRARFVLEDNGDVTLTMNSSKMLPVLELQEMDTQHITDFPTPAGRLTIGDGLKSDAIYMGSTGKGEGALVFSSPKLNAQVAVGYQKYGDVADDGLGNWGIMVRGANHDFTGVGVRTKDNVPQEFLGPVK
jgi:hypothetical protein